MLDPHLLNVVSPPWTWTLYCGDHTCVLRMSIIFSAVTVGWFKRIYGRAEVAWNENENAMSILERKKEISYAHSMLLLFGLIRLISLYSLLIAIQPASLRLIKGGYSSYLSTYILSIFVMCSEAQVCQCQLFADVRLPCFGFDLRFVVFL